MTQQKGGFLQGVGSPHKKNLWVSTMKKGRQGAPILLQGVSRGTPDTTVSLCPRMWSRDWRQQVTKCKVQKGGCMPKSKIVIASLIHSQPLIPGDTKTLNATLETFFPEIYPCRCSDLPLSGQKATYLTHTTLSDILHPPVRDYLIQTNLDRLLSKCTHVCFLRRCWGKQLTGTYCESCWSSHEIINVRQSDRKRKKMMMQLSRAGI